MSFDPDSFGVYEEENGQYVRRSSRNPTNKSYKYENSDSSGDDSSESSLSLSDEDGDDENFEEELMASQKKRSNGMKKKAAPAGIRKGRKSFDKQFVEEYDFNPLPPRRTSKARASTFDSDSESESSSFEYSDSSEPGVAFRRERRRSNEISYAEEDENSESDEYSENENEKKEEFSGPRIERIIGHEQDSSDPPKYYVKFVGEAYIHCRWMNEKEILDVRNGQRRIQMYRDLIKREVLVPSETIPSLISPVTEVFCPDFLEVQRVIAKNEEGKFLVRWQRQRYEDATWEDKVDDDDSIQEFEKRNNIDEALSFSAAKRPDPKDFKEYGPDNPIPKFKGDLELRDYQLKGLNWLRFCWYHRRSSILADEMGLGKTVMGVSMILDLYRMGNRGPFLVVAPLSTLEQWEREFRRWTDINAINFSGGKKSRQIISDYELWFGERRDICKFVVLLLNSDIINQERDLLTSIEWQYLIVDEAHNLKNFNSKRYQLMKELRVHHILLMTGTPIQNNLEELWSLLYFIAPQTFSNLQDFMNRYGNVSTEDDVKRLQNDVLKMYMLRRKKADVEHSIGIKEETIVKVELTKSQKLVYRMLIDNKASELITGSTKLPSMNNLMMQLRKVCNHPYLIEGAESQIIENVGSPLEKLILCSGKMVFVDKLLLKLRPLGNKVLIFSQMVKVLDLLQDFLDVKGYRYERIDGSVVGNRRQAAIDRFNNPDLDIFVFLLCTKAGGLGLNLTAANTVIIYDSDWNPQNDLQAQARCHRIGQKDKVKVYRLITRDTYENEMFIRASRKLGLDQALLDSKRRSDDDEMSKEDIELLLKKGAYHIIKEDDEEGERFINEDIDQILERRTELFTKSQTDSNSLFSEASFAADPKAASIDLNDKHFWEKLMPEAKLRVEGQNNFIFTKRTVKATCVYGDDDVVSSGSWNKAARDRAFKGLQLYGFGQWEMISNTTKLQGNVSEVKDGCMVMINLISNGNKAVANQIIGDDFKLNHSQRSLSESEVFKDPSFAEKISKNSDKIIERLLVLNKIKQWYENGKQSINIKAEGKEWSNKNDLSLLESILKHGYGNWDDVFSDTNYFPDDFEQPSSKFLEKRIRKIIESISSISEDEVPKKKTEKKHSDKKDPKKSKTDHSKKADSSKKVKSKPKKDESLSVFIECLILCGEPKSEDLLKDIGKLSKYKNSNEEIVSQIYEASVFMKEEGTLEQSEFEMFAGTLTKTNTKKLLESRKWFNKFRKFMREQYPEKKKRLSSIRITKDDPSFWQYSLYEPPLLEHVNTKGFLFLDTLLLQPPYESHLSLKEKDSIHNEKGSVRLPNGISSFAFFQDFESIQRHIDRVTHELLYEGKPREVLEIASSIMKHCNLPIVQNENGRQIMIESLGNGEFFAVDGYLCRVGFRSRFKNEQKVYSCSIIDDDDGRFLINFADENYQAQSPEGAWKHFGITEDARMCFGISLPQIRYWLQQQLGNKFISGYEPLDFKAKVESVQSSNQTKQFSSLPKLEGSFLPKKF